MIDEHKKLELDTQPAYDPPQALRLGDVHTGAGGVLCSNGSGDVAECTVGFSASICDNNGNTADLCDPTGNAAFPGPTTTPPT